MIKPEFDKKMEKENNFYIIKSDKAMEHIENEIHNLYKTIGNKSSGNDLSGTGELKPFGCIKCIWYKGKETNKSLCLIDGQIYEKLKSEGYEIEPYDTQKLNMPRENETNNLFFKLPKDITLTKCQNFFGNKIHILNKYNMINEKDYKINYPRKSRERNIHGDKAFMIFDIDDVKKIALIRLYFSSLRWDTDNRTMCFWAREQNNKNQWVKPLIYNVTKK